MGSDLLVDALVRLVLLWLCFLLPSSLWREGRLAGGPPPSTPAHKGSPEPKPFPGLLHNPPGADCGQALKTPVVSSPSAPPPQMISTRGRRRVVATSFHFCPQPRWVSQGWVGRGTGGAKGHPSGRAWHQLPCTACGRDFLETHDTLSHGQRLSPPLLVWAIGTLAAGRGMRAVAVSSRWSPIPSCPGSLRPPTSSRPLLSASFLMCRAPRCNSLHSMPCSARSRRARSRRPKLPGA
jgi:hypothetical protein